MPLNTYIEIGIGEFNLDLSRNISLGPVQIKHQNKIKATEGEFMFAVQFQNGYRQGLIV